METEMAQSFGFFKWSQDELNGGTRLLTIRNRLILRNFSLSPLPDTTVTPVYS
jgi:hypothetical protein